MPARAPAIEATLATGLAVIGARVRAHRKGLRVSATDAAEASGMSRVTLHRIERGEPSVAMAAYLSALAALGLEVDLVGPQARAAASPPRANRHSCRPLFGWPNLRNSGAWPGTCKAWKR